MGDIVSQDRAYTLQIIHALLQMYEDEWNNPEKEMPLKTLCSCMFLLVSSLGGMRGFEVMWTDLAALRYDLEYCKDIGDTSAVSWPVVGRFKAHNGVLGCYMITIAGKTNSGVKFLNGLNVLWDVWRVWVGSTVGLFKGQMELVRRQRNIWMTSIAA
jgi:hypothetical protein